MFIANALYLLFDISIEMELAVHSSNMARLLSCVNLKRSIDDKLDYMTGKPKRFHCYFCQFRVWILKLLLWMMFLKGAEIKPPSMWHHDIMISISCILCSIMMSTLQSVHRLSYMWSSGKFMFCLCSSMSNAN